LGDTNLLEKRSPFSPVQKDLEEGTSPGEGWLRPQLAKMIYDALPNYGIWNTLGVEDMARAAGLSRAHFSREFRRAFGESPSHTLRAAGRA